MRTGDNGYIKELNYKLILDTIRTHGTVSRADLSRLTGLTRSTCSVICDRMIKQGIIMEIGTSDSTGGRPPIRLQINNRAGSVLGLKIMDDQIAGATVDLGGSIIEYHMCPMNRQLEASMYLTQLEQFTQKILDHHTQAYPLIPVLGIGIGIGGRVDKKGVLLDSSILGWQDIPLKDRLQKRFSMPVHVENDVNTFAIGEKYFGSGKEYHSFLCLTLGEGIGLGIIVQNQLYSGAHHGAGEIGHTRISFDHDAPICSCGKRGCLEAYTSDRALLSSYKQLQNTHVSLQSITIEDLTRKAQAGDDLALQVFSEAGRLLGMALSTLVNIFDPQAIIIGGERTSASEFVMPSLEHHLSENCVYNLAKEVKLIVLQPSNDDWIRGVAALAIREFFSNNLLWRE